MALGGPPALAGGDARTLFQQPRWQSIGGHFHVPTAEHRYPADQAFNLVLWQPNPDRADGGLVPTDWPAGDKTGFYPRAPGRAHQLAFRDANGATTAQADGDAVGAYLNSRDIAGRSAAEKMMIAPAFKPREADWTYPFATAGAVLVNRLELQVPTAIDASRPGNSTYVATCLVFRDRLSGTRISYAVALFHHAPAFRGVPARAVLQRNEVGNFDPPSRSFEVGNPLAPGSRVVDILPGSEPVQHRPWTGWKPFSLAITAAEFETALASLRDRQPGFTGDGRAASYALIGWHLNAELKFASGPAELGWSMRHATLTLDPG